MTKIRAFSTEQIIWFENFGFYGRLIFGWYSVDIRDHWNAMFLGIAVS